MFTVYQSLTLIRCMSVLVSHTKVNTCYDELMIRNFNDNSTQKLYIHHINSMKHQLYNMSARPNSEIYYVFTSINVHCKLFDCLYIQSTLWISKIHTSISVMGIVVL